MIPVVQRRRRFPLIRTRGSDARRPRRKPGRSRRWSFEPMEERVLLSVVFADSFEQGEWSGKWVEDGQNDWQRSSSRASDGSFAAEVDGGATDATLTMANPLDLNTYTSAELSFSWLIENPWDSGEYIALDFYDGNGWTEVTSLRGNVDQENVWHSETVNIDANYLVDGFNVRFRASVSSPGEDGYVDSVQIVGTPTDPVKVFLLVGQSNMGGSPSVDDLPPPYDAPQSDVWVWQDDLGQNVGWTPLRGGFGGGSNHNAGGDGSKFGPEISFGRALADALPDTHFALIKHTQAGTAATMQDGWSPDRGGGAGPGQIWTDFIAKSQDALAALDNSQVAYEVAGLIVAQGGRDTQSETGVEAANYEQNFTQFISAVRQEFGEPQLPVVFGQVGDGRQTGEHHDGWVLVRAAQEAVAATDPLATMIQVDDLTLMDNDNAHFDGEGQLVFGGRLASAYLGEPFDGSAKVGTDGFETGGFSGGYEQWSTGAWTVAGDASVTATGLAFGAYCAQLQGGSADLIRSVDVTGLANVKLRFHSRLDSFEAPDRAQVKVSGDGVNWTTLLEFVDGQDDNVDKVYQLAVPNLGDTVYVRFDAEMDGLDDYWYVDAVKLAGTVPAAVPPNLNPTITSTPVTTATQDLPYSYDVDATDPDAGDTLTYSLDVFPVGMTVDPSTGVIDWTPGGGQVGLNAVTVRAQDQLGGSDTQSFTIDVINVNDPPSITSSPITTATEGVLYTYDVDASDPDVGETLTYSLDTSPAGMNINASSGVIDWTPNGQLGSHPVTVRVQDAAGAFDTQSFTIDVSEAPAGVTVADIVPNTMSADSSGLVTINGAGFMDGASVTFAGGSGPSPSASNIVVAADGLSITATVSTHKKSKASSWDVVVTNPDASTDSCVDCFNVTVGGAASAGTTSTLPVPSTTDTDEAFATTGDTSDPAPTSSPLPAADADQLPQPAQTPGSGTIDDTDLVDLVFSNPATLEDPLLDELAMTI